jgi:hypothetical protein
MQKRASVPRAVRSWQRTRETGSAGRPAEQLLDTSALALGRASRAAVAGSHRDGLLAGRRGRAVVDIALGGNRGAGPLGDDPLDDHDALASFVAQPYLITSPYGMRGLDPHPVDPDVPGAAGTGRGRAGPGQPHRPDPAVHPPSLITCHSANCNAIRARRLRPADFVREYGDQMLATSGPGLSAWPWSMSLSSGRLGRGRGVAGIERRVRKVGPLPGRGASMELDGRRLAGEVASAVGRLLSGGSALRTCACRAWTGAAGRWRPWTRR